MEENTITKEGNTDLMEAIKSKNYKQAKQLIEAGAEVNAKNNQNETAFMMFKLSHLAIDFENDWNKTVDTIIDMMSFLLDKQADINLADENGQTVLMKFINNDDRVTEFLIKQGANINAVDEKGETPLIYAMYQRGHIYGNTQIGGNCNGQLGFIKLLINNNAKINIKTKEGHTPLMIASEKHCDKIVDLLIKQGANVDKKDTKGETAFLKVFKNTGFGISRDGSANNDIFDTLKIFLDSKTIKLTEQEKKRAFKIVIEKNLSDAIKLFIAYGVDIENIDIQSLFLKSLWHFDNFALSDYLLDTGLDINSKDTDGNSFLHLALQDNSTLQIIKYLIEHHADINLQNKDGWTPLMVLIKNSNNEKDSIFSYMLENNVNINILSNHHLPINALTLAMINKEENIYTVLRDKKTDSLDTLKYLLANDLYFEKEYFEKYLVDLLSNEVTYNTRLALLESWSYFDKRIDVDKIDKCISLLEKLKINIGKEGEMEIFGLEPNIEQELKDNLHSIDSITFEKVLKQFIEFPNKPQDLVKILTNFTTDKPMKYTTHIWDFGTLKNSTYKDFNGYMDAVKIQWEVIKDELEILSLNLYKKVYNFLWEKNPKIALGWSSTNGLREWCDSGKNPFDFENFENIVFNFKKEIEIRKEDNVFENIFINIEEELDDKYEDIFSFELKKLVGVTFYTDTEKLTNALKIIFSQISEKSRHEFGTIVAEASGDSTQDYIELKIIQKNAKVESTANVMLEEINNGDFATIKENLTNLCDWSIEGSFDDKDYRVNYLKSNSVVDIEMLNSKPLGFTHIMRFYNK